MKWDAVAKLLAAIGPVIVALMGLAASSAAMHNRRSRLKHDAELLKLLPEQSDSRKLLEAHIERTIVRLAEDDEKRRDPFGIVLALVFLGFAGWTWMLTLDGSNWWAALATPLTVVGCVGLGSDAFRAKRDEQGRRIRETRRRQ